APVTECAAVDQEWIADRLKAGEAEEHHPACDCNCDIEGKTKHGGTTRDCDIEEGAKQGRRTCNCGCDHDRN
ncbi:MAG: hypothetical protein MJ014_07365, partial [Methanocorpusculum sp.]|nr:hypothetical protein [Methanocorpusculum sp.]